MAESQIEGVRESGGSWFVQLEIDGKKRYGGKYETYEQAMDAFQSAKEKQKLQKDEDKQVSKVISDTPLIEVSIEDEVREALRNIVCQVDWNETRPVAPPTYSRPDAGDVGRLCRFGVECKRTDIFHWVEADHPDDHPRMGTPALPLPQFKLNSMVSCHHWRQKSFCGLGETCRFMHDPSKRGSEWVENHRVRNNVGGWRNRGRKNTNRGAVFRRFLIDTFGFDHLRSGSGVLDVAGGGSGGGLAFQLLNYSSIPATVVDPRAPDSKRPLDSLRFAGPYRTSPLNSKYHVDLPPRSSPRFPPFIQSTIEEAVNTYSEVDEALLQLPDLTIQEDGEKDSTKKAITAPQPFATTETEAEMEVIDKVQIGRVMKHCSVVCGLHPDGATEPLVDYAIQHGKAFAIVPCCVFWRSNPLLLEEGVRSYEDFLAHLMAKLPEGQIKRDKLAFDGRSAVLWWAGEENTLSR